MISALSFLMGLTNEICIGRTQNIFLAIKFLFAHFQTSHTCKMKRVPASDILKFMPISLFFGQLDRIC